jgi:hypothetical protein
MYLKSSINEITATQMGYTNIQIQFIIMIVLNLKNKILLPKFIKGATV